ncbi:MAG: electron transport complex subunit RsxC [Oscillospiraceae bacterium]|jgi:electron transport complex protein RnfC|nr:electron transport complex subunit RsxC [Oscillospiraceae bacterium]
MRSFHGGIHPNDGKALSRNSPIELLAAPEQVVIPLSMHIGAPAKPRVSVGDSVSVGTVIGEAATGVAGISAPVHSSVSGSVSAVEERLHPNGRRIVSVVIDNDFRDTYDASVVPQVIDERDYSTDIIRILHAAGVVGMGGATFPAHYKLASGLNRADTLIINGAECEPFITSDHRVLLEDTDAVLRGIRHLRRALGLEKAILAVEANKADAITLLREKLKGTDDIEVRVLKTRYPQGSEKQLIQSVTGRLVPSGKLPADVNCVVFNVYTAWSLNQAIETGLPVIDRVVTVSGPGIVRPKNLRIRLGTPVRAALKAAGGLKEDTRKVLLGGPMMGNAIYDLDVPVIKGTNSIVALSPEQIHHNSEVEGSCIRCGRCISVCPMLLQPVYLYAYERKDKLDDLKKLNIMDCMECGSCAYTCPGRLHLVQAIRSGKAKIRALPQ